MTELSPYQLALRQDLIDYELLRVGIDAYERISGVNCRIVWHLPPTLNGIKFERLCGVESP